MAKKNTKSPKGTDTPHDTLVREHFQHPENALGLIRAGLPPEVFAELDTSTLRHKGIHLSTTALLKSVTDLVFTCSLRDGSDAYVHIVLEHKSNPDALVAVQILKYMALIWDYYRRKHPNNTRLPFIIPLIFYHGQAKWEPRPLRSLFPQDSPLLAYVPHFDLSICNLHNVDENQLRQDVVHNAMLLLLKALLDAEPLSHIVQALNIIGKTCSDAGIVDVLELFFNYLAQIRPEITIDAIDEELAKLPEGGTMSQLWQERWAEYSYKQGAIFGKQAGKAEGARTLLCDFIFERFGTVTPEVTVTLNAIDDVDVLRKLATATLKVDSLNEFTPLLREHMKDVQQS